MKNKKRLIPIAAIIIMGIVFTVIVKKSVIHFQLSL